MSQYVDPSAFDTNLRLGDIIIGFSYIMPTFDDFFNAKSEFKLDIKDQNFFAVLTPCCSIENKIITLTPLRQIKYQLLSNSYFKEDLTRINRPIPAYKQYTDKAWDEMSEEIKEEIMAKEPGYGFFENYFYSPHEALPEYILKYKKNPELPFKYYMIDFKEAFTITSKLIQRGMTYPKTLQLTIQARDELRNKLAYYFSRIPEEDKSNL